MKLVVGNLSGEMTDAELRSLFSPYGTPLAARVRRNLPGFFGRGFGLVEFESSDEARMAIREMNGREVDGRPLRVGEAREPERHNMEKIYAPER